MIIKGSALQEVNYRTDYGVGRLQDKIGHFVVRVTTPANPFGPHKHDGVEFWYILEGQGTVSIDGQESAVEPGDLVVLLPWTNHGLTTQSRVRWICLG